MADSTKERCGNCRYCILTGKERYINIDKSIKEGRCHRFPPTKSGKDCEFPLVTEDEWCGEWGGK